MSKKQECPPAPEAWTKLGPYLHQDFLLEHADFYDGIALLIRGTSPEDRRIIKQYLEIVLGPNAPGGCASRAWKDLGAEIVPSNPKTVLLEMQGMIGSFSQADEPPSHNKGFNRTPVSSAAAKPGESGGGAG